MTALLFLELLDIYGQKINWDKTQIFFNFNIDHHTQSIFKDQLGVLATSQFEKYLLLFFLSLVEQKDNG